MNFPFSDRINQSSLKASPWQAEWTGYSHTKPKQSCKSCLNECFIQGRKFFVRYLLSNYFLETEEPDQPITDQDSIVDLYFDLDIDRVENIISGISKQSSFGTDFKR